MSEKLPPFRVSRYNEAIILFRFDNLGADAARLWGEYSLKFKDKLNNPLRILYDLVDCGPPSPYFNEYQNMIMPQLNLPEDIRTAYWIPRQSYAVWVDIFARSRRYKTSAQIRYFVDKDEAIAWLMKGLELGKDRDNENIEQS